MKINKKTCELLAKYGFKWYKEQCTDTVSADCIKRVIPAANGFTVVYNDKASALEMSTAEVSKIEMPENLDHVWILVHWKNIVDQRRDLCEDPE